MRLKRWPMFISESQDVIKRMEYQFDAHDFILKFIQAYAHSYFSLLGKYEGDVRKTDAYIGSFLQLNASELSISKVGKTISKNIMSNETECMLWEKLLN